MKKKLKFILILIFTIILSSCSTSNPDQLEDLILSPQLDKPILEGTWQVVKVESITEKNTNPTVKIGDNLYINKNLVAINNEYAFPPSFSSKFVNLKEYLSNRGFEYINIDDTEDVVVVNASQGQFFARDFIKRSDDEIFYIADDNLIYLSKLSNTVEPAVVDKYTAVATNERANPEENIVVEEDIALLLGVRERIDQPNGQIDYNYFTYLISIPTEDKVTYKKANDIFLRGQDEYWKVRSRKNALSGYYDNIEAFPARLENQMDEQINIDRYTFKDFDMNIRMNFVDRDYISFSYSRILFDNTITKYGFVETTDLEDNRLITIDEFTGENDATEQFKNIVKNEALNKLPDVNPEDLLIDNKNFGILRDNGMWVTQTSIYTSESQITSASQIPIRNYVEEKSTTNPTITRDQVRNINSQYKDFHIISNTNYIVIQTQDEILFHKINNGQIDKKPFFSISTSNPTAFIAIDQLSGTNAATIEQAFINNNVIIDSN